MLEHTDCEHTMEEAQYQLIILHCEIMQLEISTV